MLRNVFLKSLRDQGKGLLWWSLGVGGYVALMMLFYPTVRNSADLINSYMEVWPDAFKTAFMGQFQDLASPAGFLTTYMLSMIGPMLFLIYSIGLGSDAIAGEEDRGTLDLLLANPVSRGQVLLHKFAALTAATTVLTAVYGVTLAAGAAAVAMDVNYGGLLAAIVSTLLLSVCLGALALATAAASGSKGLGGGVAAAVGVAAYVVNAFAPMVEGLQPYQKLSLFYLYLGNDPLTNGLSLTHASALVVVTAVFVAGGVYLFNRRDLAV